MRLQAGHAERADDGVVGRTGRQLEPIADHQADGLATIRQPEVDAARGDDDDLVVGVLVGRIPVAGAVGPWRGGKTLGPQACHGLADRGHVSH